MERDRLPFTGARFFKVVSIILASVARIRPPPLFALYSLYPLPP